MRVARVGEDIECNRNLRTIARDRERNKWSARRWMMDASCRGLSWGWGSQGINSNSNIRQTDRPKDVKEDLERNANYSCTFISTTTTIMYAKKHHYLTTTLWRVNVKYLLEVNFFLLKAGIRIRTFAFNKTSNPNFPVSSVSPSQWYLFE